MDADPKDKGVQQVDLSSEYKGRDRPGEEASLREETQSRTIKEEVEEKYTLPRRREHRGRAGMSNLSHVTKLEGPQNYQVWATGLKGVALSNRVWKVMNGTVPRPTLPANASDTQQETYTARLEDWEEAEEIAQGYILQTVKQGPASHLTDSMDAPKMFETLRSMYKTKGYTERHLHWKTINRSDLSKYKNVSEYAEAMKKARTMIEDMGHQVLDWQMTSSFLHGLGDSYTAFVTTILTTRQLGADGEPVEPDFDRLVAQLIDIEKRGDASSNNKSSSSTKALKTESKGSRNSERKAKGAGSSSTSTKNPDGAKCSVCNSQWHMDDKCWVKHPAQATDDWREKNESRIDEYRQKSKDLNTSNTSEGKKKKPMGGMVAKANKASLYRDHAWYMDSAASYHMTFDASLFDTIRPSSKEAELADGTPVRAMGVGTITLNILVNGELLKQPLHEVYYMPELDNNLLSVGYLEKKGFPFEASNGRMRIKEGKEVRLEATRFDTLYVLNQPPNPRVMMTKKDTHDVVTWHRRLAHLNEKDIRRLATMSTGITGLEGHIKDCEACALGKAHRQPNHRKSTKATKPFERVHADLGGGGSTLTMSVGRNKYYILYTDDCTRFRWLDVLRTKDKALESFRKFNSMVETQFNTRIRRFQTDQGGEFKSNEMEEYLAEKRDTMGANCTLCT